MTNTITLIDDHHLMRAGLAATVNGLGDFQVTMEAGNGRELILELAKASASDTALPAIAIVDLNMPVMDGYETIAWLRTHAPTVLPLALTFDATEDAMVKAVRVGARGFLLKNTRPAVLKNALESIVRTGYYYAEETHDVLYRYPDLKTREERERDHVLEQITQRELEFLLLVCDEAEYTYEKISEQMGVQRRTVDNYRIGLFEKFNIRSKTGLVLFAMRWGLLTAQV